MGSNKNHSLLNPINSSKSKEAGIAVPQSGSSSPGTKSIVISKYLEPIPDSSPPPVIPVNPDPSPTKEIAVTAPFTLMS